MAQCLLALGANIGDRKATLERCIQIFCAHPHIRWVAQSSFHTTTPIGGPQNQEPYLNAALRVDTSLAPMQLFRWAVHVEHKLGRRREIRWGPRTIDIDLLLYDAEIFVSKNLELPHPRMITRRFVLAPAIEIADDMFHPTTGWSVHRLWQHLNAAPNYVALAGPTRSGKSTTAQLLARPPTIQALIAPAPTVTRSGPLTFEDVSADIARREALVRQHHLTLANQMAFATEKHPDATVVADFCCAQPPFHPDSWYDADDPTQTRPLVKPLPPAPRLVALLDVPADQLVVRLLAGPANGLRPDGVARLRTALAAHCQALSRWAAAPESGPVLRVRGDQDAVLAELNAAIVAAR